MSPLDLTPLGNIHQISPHSHHHPIIFWKACLVVFLYCKRCFRGTPLRRCLGTPPREISARLLLSLNTKWAFYIPVQEIFTQLKCNIWLIHCFLVFVFQYEQQNVYLAWPILKLNFSFLYFQCLPCDLHPCRMNQSLLHHYRADCLPSRMITRTRSFTGQRAQVQSR